MASLKALYEEKYNEVILRISYLESDLNEKFQESLLIKELNGHIAKLDSENIRIKLENEKLMTIIDKMKQEKGVLNGKIINLEDKLKKTKTENVKVKAEISLIKAEECKGTSKSLEKFKRQQENVISPIKTTRIVSVPKIVNKTIIYKDLKTTPKSFTMGSSKQRIILRFCRSKKSMKSLKIQDSVNISSIKIN
ncbi:hypothetical protein SteCoe_10285 [Stentor coeruleus]|uniref:Uncharacterized protein n=1 Tax=Stentor coeruleus TaxID=5963 RepID=A0A1R2CG12_9CILI|nr:hypothetical protein SteCoe_10285 [Stentor coeruleus]